MRKTPSIADLPLEIIYEIVTWNIETWKSAVFSLPFVHRGLSSELSRIKRKFTIVKKFVDGDFVKVTYKLCGKLHREDGPASAIEADGYAFTEYMINGTLHREDGPASVEIDEDNKVEIWYEKGKEHRIGGPAYIEFYEDDILEEIWFEEGEIHRIGGPAATNYKICDDNYLGKEETWYEKGKKHRIGGPAEILYSEEEILEESWYQNGKLHREDGPAVTILFPEDGKRKEIWYRRGVLHREEKDDEGKLLPAKITYYLKENEENKEKKSFYINGKKIE